MNRKIMIEFPDIKSKFSATLLDEEEPELCDRFWKALEKPLKMICHHTLSTGQLFEAHGRPQIHPVEVGSQANPIGRKQWLLSKLDPGMLMYCGKLEVDFAYGPHITEPLASSGSWIAKVDPDCLDDLMKAGKTVWNAQYMTHRLVTMTVRRKEK
jgi:hypothetical protein